MPRMSVGSAGSRDRVMWGKSCHRVGGQDRGGGRLGEPKMYGFGRTVGAGTGAGGRTYGTTARERQKGSMGGGW